MGVKGLVLRLQVLILVFAPVLWAADGFAKGTGTAANPYQITSAAELNNVRTKLGVGKYFKLMNDIDLTVYLATGPGFTTWGGNGWMPIGDETTKFAGVFDGAGFEIRGLNINRTDMINVGLFGYTATSAIIKNMGIEGGVVRGGTNVGGLVGRNAGSITASYSGAVVSASAFLSSAVAGGLVGHNDGSIAASYASGAVGSGGLSSGVVGGLVGRNFGSIASSYALGAVSSGYFSSGKGGLTGNTTATGTVTSSFWNITTTGRNSDGASSGATGLTTDQMKLESSYPGLDFVNTWVIYDGMSYPLLRAFMTQVTVVASAATKVYDAQVYTLGFSVTFSKPVANPDSLRNLLTYKGSSQNAVNAGDYVILVGGLTSSQQGYAFDFVNATLTITKAPLTVTADAKTKVYGTADPALTASYSGFVAGDDSSVLGDLSVTRAVGESVTDYAINATATSANYALSFAPATLTITKAPLTVTADAKTKVYGAVDPTLTATYSGFVGNDDASVLGGLNVTRAAGESVADYAINATGTSANYALTFEPATLSITKAPLTITADAKTKIYGAADPALTASYSGFVGNDDASVLSDLSITRAVGESVADYAINATGTSANYALTFEPATLTITKAPLTITADAKTKIYGAADPTFTASYNGFVGNDDASVLSGLSVTRAVGESVADYAITATATSANYALTFEPANLSITKAPLTITADAKTKVYGSVDPTFTASYSGLVGNDDASVLSGLSVTRAAGESVADYAINATATSANYALTFEPANLTITKAPLTITADAKTKVYGAADPALTATYSGFVAGDNESMLRGLSVTRAVGESVADYAITATATSANYALTFEPANLTITKAPLTVAADAKTKIYGAADPALTATYSGFVGNDDASVLSGLSVTRAVGESVADYAINATATSANYALIFKPANLTITKAPLTITADVKTKVYGSVDPTFTASYSGFVGNDDASVLSDLSVTRAAGESVADYAINATATSANYALTFEPATLSITKAPLTITADAKTKVYGSVDPTFTASYSGFVAGDDASVLGGLSVTRAAGESVGTYVITSSGVTIAASYYKLIFVPATLTITKAPLTITVEDVESIIGDTWDYDFGYTGLVNDDDSSVVSDLVATPSCDECLVPGKFDITLSGASATNYDISYGTGKLTLNSMTRLKQRMLNPRAIRDLRRFDLLGRQK